MSGSSDSFLRKNYGITTEKLRNNSELLREEKLNTGGEKQTYGNSTKRFITELQINYNGVTTKLESNYNEVTTKLEKIETDFRKAETIDSIDFLNSFSGINSEKPEKNSGKTREKLALRGY